MSAQICPGGGPEATARTPRNKTSEDVWPHRASLRLPVFALILCYARSLHLYPRTFLPTAARESLARRRRSRRLGRALSRLERANHRRMLRAERRLSNTRRRRTHCVASKQLYQDEF